MYCIKYSDDNKVYEELLSLTDLRILIDNFDFARSYLNSLKQLLEINDEEAFFKFLMMNDLDIIKNAYRLFSAFTFSTEKDQIPIDTIGNYIYSYPNITSLEMIKTVFELIKRYSVFSKLKENKDKIHVGYDELYKIINPTYTLSDLSEEENDYDDDDEYENPEENEEDIEFFGEETKMGIEIVSRYKQSFELPNIGEMYNDSLFRELNDKFLNIKNVISEIKSNLVTGIYCNDLVLSRYKEYYNEHLLNSKKDPVFGEENLKVAKELISQLGKINELYPPKFKDYEIISQGIKTLWNTQLSEGNVSYEMLNSERYDWVSELEDSEEDEEDINYETIDNIKTSWDEGDK